MGARTAVTMILVVENLFGSAAVAPFCDEVIGHFESGTLPIPEIQSSSGTARLYHLYHISYILYHITCISVPRTIFGKLVSSFAALSPHSIGPERAVSCHTTLKGPKQSCYSREAINRQMAIALNSCWTCSFLRPTAISSQTFGEEKSENDSARWRTLQKSGLCQEIVFHRLLCV